LIQAFFLHFGAKCGRIAVAKAGAFEFGENICERGNSLSSESKIFANDTRARKLSKLAAARLERQRIGEKSLSEEFTSDKELLLADGCAERKLSITAVAKTGDFGQTL